MKRFITFLAVLAGGFVSVGYANFNYTLFNNSLGAETVVIAGQTGGVSCIYKGTTYNPCPAYKLKLQAGESVILNYPPDPTPCMTTVTFQYYLKPKWNPNAYPCKITGRLCLPGGKHTDGGRSGTQYNPANPVFDYTYQPPGQECKYPSSHRITPVNP